MSDDERPLPPPWLLAKRVYELARPEVAFDQLLVEFMALGYVWASPTEFLIARPTRLDAEDPVWWDGATGGAADAWLVVVAVGAGALARFQELAPFPLPHVCWHRDGRGRLHVWSWEKFQRKVNHGHIRQGAA